MNELTPDGVDVVSMEAFCDASLVLVQTATARWVYDQDRSTMTAYYFAGRRPRTNGQPVPCATVTHPPVVGEPWTWHQPTDRTNPFKAGRSCGVGEVLLVHGVVL